jgi:predicted N-formylglutamate amidohydrolase
MRSYHATLRKSSPILLTCEHGSKRIPRRYNKLGLTRYEIFHAKDLDDPGCMEMMRSMQKEFNASILYANMSRLVIDCNRPLLQNPANRHHASALKYHVLVGDDNGDYMAQIPGNQDKTMAEERRRFEKYAKPYQEKGRDMVRKLLNVHQKVYIIQLHTFFPYYNGQKREIEIDAIFGNGSKKFGNKFYRYVKEHTDYNVAKNKPWAMEDVSGGAFGQFFEHDPRVEILAIEVRNDIATDPSRREELMHVFNNAVRELTNTTSF